MTVMTVKQDSLKGKHKLQKEKKGKKVLVDISKQSKKKLYFMLYAFYLPL